MRIHMYIWTNSRMFVQYLYISKFVFETNVCIFVCMNLYMFACRCMYVCIGRQELKARAERARERESARKRPGSVGKFERHRCLRGRSSSNEKREGERKKSVVSKGALKGHLVLIVWVCLCRLICVDMFVFVCTHFVCT